MSTPVRHSAVHSRRALGDQAGLGRAPGTPVGRLLASEGLPVRSPRRVRQRSLQQKIRDWPANFLLSLETSISLFSLDPAGYPLAIACNGLHFLIRLPGFYSALPSFSSIISRSSASRYARQAAAAAGDADARLESLQRQARSGHGGTWTWLAWWLSVALILISLANALYLATRRRKYQMVLRRDPLSSPNAKSTQLEFSPTRHRASAVQGFKTRVKRLIWHTPEEEPHTFPVQELHVWTPDYVKWSLRFFTLYSPPIAFMYHFLSPSNFFPLLICGSLVHAQTFLLVHFYTQLISDRAALQAEVAHEYNAKFVYPRIFVQKKDACVSTSEAEFVQPEDYRLYRGGRQHELQQEQGDEEQEVARRGSGRKVRKSMLLPARDDGADSGLDSPAPRRKKGSLLA
ncbi:hypothetical protein JCM11251_000179 [Rhodosporidiobolus azoricus]